MIDHISRLPRSAVFASMGSGKTSAVLSVLSCVDLLDQGPVLVLAPLRVARTVWPGEIEKWDHLSGLRVSAIVGDRNEREAALATPADIYTVNYENLPWLYEKLESRWPFRTVVADELTRLKNYRSRQGGKRARALSAVAFKGIERFIGLTGTPAPNGLLDLWGQMWFIDQGQRLGRTYNSFCQRWFYKDYSGFGWLPNDWADEQIREAIADVCVKVDPTDYIDIDEPISNAIEVELPPAAAREYKRMERHFWSELEGEEIEALSAAAKSNKLLQLANGAVYPESGNSRWVKAHDEKLDALESVIEEAAGMPVLVAYHYKSDLARLQHRFKHGRVLDANTQTITDWNEGRIQLLFAHPASAGHGLDLQYGGNILCFFGLWWDLEAHDQIIERIGPLRQYQAGFKRPVYLHYILAKGTIDSVVYHRLESKRSVQSVLLEAMKERIE